MEVIIVRHSERYDEIHAKEWKAKVDTHTRSFDHQQQQQEKQLVDIKHNKSYRQTGGKSTSSVKAHMRQKQSQQEQQHQEEEQLLRDAFSFAHDPPITENGKRIAAMAGQTLKRRINLQLQQRTTTDGKLPEVIIFASKMLRTVETAYQIALELQSSPIPYFSSAMPTQRPLENGAFLAENSKPTTATTLAATTAQTPSSNSSFYATKLERPKIYLSSGLSMIVSKVRKNRDTFTFVSVPKLIEMFPNADFIDCDFDEIGKSSDGTEEREVPGKKDGYIDEDRGESMDREEREKEGEKDLSGKNDAQKQEEFDEKISIAQDDHKEWCISTKTWRKSLESIIFGAQNRLLQRHAQATPSTTTSGTLFRGNSFVLPIVIAHRETIRALGGAQLHTPYCCIATTTATAISTGDCGREGAGEKVGELNNINNNNNLKPSNAGKTAEEEGNGVLSNNISLKLVKLWDCDGTDIILKQRAK